ncbi:MAG: patatin-like phospholipase family protein [Acidobacteria bacterium]|nr:patatin-like phospholipase family protein [Acidobacteriota bacterium]
MTPNEPEKGGQTAAEPVQYLESDAGREPAEGTALCLSGGGYRAMLFHTGALWRLNELGCLPRLNRVSSVSGGSITAGLLALKWNALDFQNGTAANFADEIVAPIRRLAARTIDVSSVLTGTLWFGTIGDKIAQSYRDHLYGDATLQDIVDEVPGVSPRFVINATNVQSGALWRFMKPYMRDYRVGEVKNPTIDLAVAVAASSAFPPVLSPVELDLDPQDFTPGSGLDLEGDEFRTQIVLTDGGVYDNLGLETAWKRYKTILISDAGGGFAADADPHRDWVRHSVRVLLTIDNQVRSLRKRQAVQAFIDKVRQGTYWTIAADAAADYKIGTPLACPFERTDELARIDTRLKKLDAATQERLINWGYAVADLGIRQYVDPAAAPPNAFPYPETKV